MKLKKNVLAVIINKSGKVLIGKYNSEFPSRMFPKGGVKKGEGILEALLREIWEETSIPEKDIVIYQKHQKKYIKLYSDSEKNRMIEKKGEFYDGKEENIFFIKHLGYDKDAKTNDNEFSELKWVDINEIKNYIKNEELINIIDLNNLGSIRNLKSIL